MLANFSRAEYTARDLLVRSGVSGSFPVDLDVILEKEGLVAKWADAGTGDGQIMDEALIDPKERTIYIRRDNLPMMRKIFSIAHEIGHWCLHSRDKRRPRIDFSKNAKPFSEETLIEEQEANAFAAELLMPFDKVKHLISFKGYDASKLAQFFEVSYEAAYFRWNFVAERFQ